MKPAYDACRRLVQSSLLLVMVLFALVAAPVSAEARTPATTRTVLVMGDSLSAAYGMPVSQGWVSLLGRRLKATHPGWTVANASVSGETTEGGLARLPRQLQRVRPAVVVIELGANDGLRGLPLARMRSNLERMVKLSQASGARVLIVGMRMPPNLGRAYTEGFHNNYIQVARQYRTGLVPFFLAPIMLDRRAFQPDNLHPTAAAQGRLLDVVWPSLRPLIR